MSAKYLVTGGAGFIGSNYVHRLLKRGEQVLIYDNLSRRGAGANLAWLRETFGEKAVQLVEGDVADAGQLARAAEAADVIVHLAGQVAVTTSVTHPRPDFEANALGTFNALGGGAPIRPESDLHLCFDQQGVWRHGGREDRREAHALAVCGPGGGLLRSRSRWIFTARTVAARARATSTCATMPRIYGLRTVVFRQSCIYGPRQFGVEDQGWLAWMIIAAVTGRPITIYGDGKQVRDVLHVDDLLDAYDAAVGRIDSCRRGRSTTSAGE